MADKLHTRTRITRSQWNLLLIDLEPNSTGYGSGAGCVCVCVYTASHCVYVCEQGGVCVCTVLPTVRVSVCVNTPSHHPPPPCPRPFPPTNKAGITGSISRANTGIQSFPCGGNGSRILIRGTRACIGQGARGASGDEQLGPGASTLIRGSCYYFQPASIQ